MRLPMAEAGRAAGDPVPLVASTRNDFSAQFSLDGKRITFASDRTGQLAVWLADADGSNAAKLFARPGEHLGSPCWSPDGKRLAFDLRVDGQQEIFAISAGGGNPVRITVEPAPDVRPSWSRDGQWIYFTSWRTGRPEIWKAPPGGGEAIQVTGDGGSSVVESPNGQFVYFLKNSGKPYVNEVWRVPKDGGQPAIVIDEIARNSYAVADHGIYYVAPPEPGEGNILKYREDSTGEERAVTRLDDLAAGILMSVAPDGRSILYTVDTTSGSDLMLVENFR